MTLLTNILNDPLAFPNLEEDREGESHSAKLNDGGCSKSLDSSALPLEIV